MEFGGRSAPHGAPPGRAPSAAAAPRGPAWAAGGLRAGTQDGLAGLSLELREGQDVSEVTEQLAGTLTEESGEFYANLLRVKAANARNLGILDAMYQQRWLDVHAVSGYSHFQGAPPPTHTHSAPGVLL